jgi:hypothetical protein
MYVNGKRKIYEIFIKLNWKSINFMSIFSVPGGMHKCFVSDSGTKGKKKSYALS